MRSLALRLSFLFQALKNWPYPSEARPVLIFISLSNLPFDVTSTQKMEWTYNCAKSTCASVSPNYGHGVTFWDHKANFLPSPGQWEQTLFPFQISRLQKCDIISVVQVSQMLCLLSIETSASSLFQTNSYRRSVTALVKDKVNHYPKKERGKNTSLADTSLNLEPVCYLFVDDNGSLAVLVYTGDEPCILFMDLVAWQNMLHRRAVNAFEGRFKMQRYQVLTVWTQHIFNQHPNAEDLDHTTTPTTKTTLVFTEIHIYTIKHSVQNYIGKYLPRNRQIEDTTVLLPAHGQISFLENSMNQAPAPILEDNLMENWYKLFWSRFYQLSNNPSIPSNLLFF